MTPIELIGLSGKAETGKDFLYHHVLAPRGYHNFSLAWHFKVALVGQRRATHDEVFVTKPPHVRRELQLEGTERGRDVYGEDVWCEHLAEWIHLLSQEWHIHKWCIPDVRFPNEVRFIQAMGGRVFRLHAPDRVAASRLSPEARAHPSETALDAFLGFDGHVFNDGASIDDLGRQVDRLLTR